MIEYPWPGNLRELRHAVERACILSSSTTLEPDAFFGEGLIDMGPAPARGNLSDYLQACERAYIQRVLDQRGGRIADTAGELGISRKSLWEKMKRLDLSSRPAARRAPS